MEEAQSASSTFSDWLGAALSSFSSAASSVQVDRCAMERKMKKLEVSLMHLPPPEAGEGVVFSSSCAFRPCRRTWSRATPT